MKNNKKKSVKNEFASVMLASGMFAGMSTLVINATNESGIYNSNQVDVSYASTIEKPVSDVGTVSNTFTPYSEIDKDDYKKVSSQSKKASNGLSPSFRLIAEGVFVVILAYLINQTMPPYIPEYIPCLLIL